MLAYHRMLLLVWTHFWMVQTQGIEEDQQIIEKLSELLQIENNYTSAVKNVMRSAKRLKDDPNYQMLKNIFKSKNKKHSGHYHTYGSFNELSGGYSARLFWPLRTPLKTCFNLYNSSWDSCTTLLDQNVNEQNQLIDIDYAMYSEIRPTEKEYIVDVPRKPGYVTIKSSDKILRSFSNIKHEKISKLQRRLSTSDGYLSSIKLCNDSYVSSSEKLQYEKEELIEPFLVDVFQKDVSYETKTTKSKRLLEFELTWKEKTKTNNIESQSDNEGLKAQVPSNGLKDKNEHSNSNGSFQDHWKMKWNTVKLLKTQWWPSIANEWKTRDRAWPRKELIDKMARYAFIKPTSVEKHFKYRFTHIEKMLTGLRSDDQDLNLFVMKILFYKYLKPISPGTLQTYTVKSIMMWTCEEYPPDHPLWKIDKKKGGLPLRMVYHMLERLKSDFQSGHSSDYFLPSLNVIKRTSNQTRGKVIKVLNLLIQTRNLQSLIPTNDITNAKTLIGRTRETVKTVNGFIQKSLKDGLLTTLSRNHPTLLLKLTKSKVRKRIRKSGLLSKMGYIFLITSFPILCCLLYYFITKESKRK